MFLKRIQKMAEEGLYVVSYLGYCRGENFTGRIFTVTPKGSKEAVEIARFLTRRKYQNKGVIVGCFEASKATESDREEYINAVKATVK